MFVVCPRCACSLQEWLALRGRAQPRFACRMQVAEGCMAWWIVFRLFRRCVYLNCWSGRPLQGYTDPKPAGLAGCPKQASKQASKQSKQASKASKQSKQASKAKQSKAKQSKASKQAKQASKQSGKLVQVVLAQVLLLKMPPAQHNFKESTQLRLKGNILDDFYAPR